MKIQELDTPSLLVDREIVIKNLQRVQAFADKHHVALRPHTKTHKMPEMAKLQLKYGSCGIAVAKTGEAEVMAAAGIDDIFIANEVVGEIKWKRICKLAETINISFGVDSPIQVEGIERVFAEDDRIAEVLIEIEVGENRSGIIKDEDFIQLLNSIKSHPHVHLKGLFSHDGNSYGAPDMQGLIDIAVYAQQRTLHFAELAKAKGMECQVISYGATPTILNEVPILEGITELRLGTYIFMDAGQAQAVHTLDMCAVTVLATVMSRPTEERVILDVGAKGLTMQTRTRGICAVEGRGIIKEDPSVHIEKMFDEHAIILNKDFREKCRIGEKYRVIPVHVCPVVNLYDKAYLVSGDEVVDTLEIACRGKLQ